MHDGHTFDPIDVNAYSAQGWRIVGASVLGPAHAATGSRREDAFAIQIAGGCALVVVCDGAGSACFAAEGAAMFAGNVLGSLVSASGGDDTLSAEQFRTAIVEGVETCRAAILERSSSLPDYHTTLLAVAATPEQTLIAHVGDGLAGVAPEGDWAQAITSMPQNGEFSNETFFVTEDNWGERMRCSVAPKLGSTGAIVTLPDGAMPFVIGPDQVGLEPSFMEPVSRHLRVGACMEVAQALAGTLNSRDARRISSDDKTLVWIGLNAD